MCCVTAGRGRADAPPRGMCSPAKGGRENAARDSRRRSAALRDTRCMVALVCLRAVGSHGGGGAASVDSELFGWPHPPALSVPAITHPVRHLVCLRGGETRQRGAGAEAGLQESSNKEREERPRTKRSRRRQLLINMKKDKRPEAAKPKDAPPLLGSRAWNGGAGQGAASVGKLERRHAREQEVSEELLDLDEAAAKADSPTLEGGRTDSAAALKSRSRKYRKMRARWGADLKGDDGQEAAEIAQARREQEACDRQMQQQKLLLGSQDENSFEWLSLGTALAMTNANRTVTKVSAGLALCQAGDRRPTGHFALWGSANGGKAQCDGGEDGPKSLDPGGDSTSTWGVRIDKLSGSPGSLIVGVLVTPFRPAECKADELMTRAWMLSDQGLLFRTGRAGREELQARASLRLPPPDALFLPQGSILVLKRHRPQQGLGSVSFQVYRPGVKYHAHATPSTTAGAVGSGRRGLSSSGEGGVASEGGGVAIPGGKGGREGGAEVAEARINGIPAGARPFLNLVQQGDRVSLIPAAELRSALKRLRSAHAGQALSVAQMLKDPTLGLKKRKQLLRERSEEREKLLRREIENDDEQVFNPLQAPVLGVEVDKDLHKDRLFQDDDMSAQDSWNLWNEPSSINEEDAQALAQGLRTDLRSRPKKDKRQADKKLEPPALSIAHQVHDMLTREPRRRQRHLRASTADQQDVDHDSSSSSFDLTQILWSEEEEEEQGANKEEEEEEGGGVVAAEREAQHQRFSLDNESPSASSLSLSAHHGSGQRSTASVKTVTSERKELKQGRDLLKRDRGPAVVKFNLDDDSAEVRVVKVKIKAPHDDQGSAVPAGAA